MKTKMFSLFAVALVYLPLLMTAQERPCKSTVVGRLDIFPLTSRIFHNTRNLRVWLPPKFDPSRNYPVLYVLDGASAFDACTADRHEEMSADETLTSLISAGKIPPLIAVGIDNGSDAIGGADGGLSRAREFIPYPAPFHPRTLEPLGASFPSFIETEVMPAVAAKYPVLNGPDHTALWGASYGGVAVLYGLINRPDLFGSGIVESPSLEVGNGQLLRDTQYLSMAPKRIAIGVGTAEIPAGKDPDADAENAMIVQMVQQLAKNLKSAYSPGQVQLTIMQGASHDTIDFGRRFAAGLLFLYGEPSTR